MRNYKSVKWFALLTQHPKGFFYFMKYSFNKTIKEEIEIDVSQPICCNFLDGMYARIVQMGDVIEITRLTINVSSKMELSVRSFNPDSDLAWLTCKGDYKKISMEYFMKVVNDNLFKNNLPCT